jgi:hypothetical protein
MSWQTALCLAALAVVALCIGGPAFAQWHKRRFLRIPYSEINRYRVTPRFIVGGDCK